MSQVGVGTNPGEMGLIVVAGDVVLWLVNAWPLRYATAAEKGTCLWTAMGREALDRVVFLSCITPSKDEGADPCPR